MNTPKNSSYYDEVFEHSEKYHVGYSDSPYWTLWTQVIQLIREYGYQSIFEIGCGTGQFAKYLYDLEYREYLGFDFSGKAVEIARGKCPLPFFVGDANERSNYQGGYDVYVAIEVMEHVPDDIRLLRNIGEGGRVIFTLPDFGSRGHVRWFRSAREIRRRYYRFVDLQEIVPVGRFFVCVGTVGEVQPGPLERLFATRDPVSPGWVWDRLRVWNKRWRRYVKRKRHLRGTWDVADSGERPEG